MEFAEITEDPLVNKTNNFFLVLGMSAYNTPNPSAVGTSLVEQGILADPNGTSVSLFWMSATQDYEVTGSLSDEAYAHSFSHRKEWLLIPPNFKFTNFSKCYGFWLSPKEVEQFILGRLSLKGGD